MSQVDVTSWQGIQEEVLRRIRDRRWKPGSQIPNEADLADEFGCSRTTVNRALRELAQTGILERKRKSGTRVALHPVERAVIDIQIVRLEIEDQGRNYGYRLLSREIAVPPHAVMFAMNLPQGEPMLHLVSMHLSDGLPYALDDRWISLTTVPDAKDADFSANSANEWLLENVPYVRAHLNIAATVADKVEQEFLGAKPGEPLLQLERATWNDDGPVTFVTFSYQPGHRLASQVPGKQPS